ncbi:MAG: sulfurtransferase [Thermomicrobiales bacterium]|nr:sulfurtransferase [Thermomicrobiales bacterium]
MNRRHFLAGIVGGLAAADAGAALGQTPTLDSFAHPEWFADPVWLGERLGDDDVSVIALTPTADFSAGHITGAVQIDWPALAVAETTESDLAVWQAAMEELLTSLGIKNGDTVVVYDGGTFWAARMWWVLYVLGHDDVRILDGGLPAWSAAGGAVEQGAPVAEAATESYRGELRMSAVATIDQVEAAVESGGPRFIDARSAGEFAGGHLPGAVNVPFTDNAMEGGVKFWKSPQDLALLYQPADITADQQIIPYCSSGVRSAVTYLTLRQMGYDNVALFTGSFDEWVSDPSRPVER